MKKKKFLITWGCDPRTGKPYQDCCLEIPQHVIDLGLVLKNLNIDSSAEVKECVSNISMMRVRNYAQQTQFALYTVDESMTRQQFEEYLKHLPSKKRLEIFMKATVRL